MATYGFFPHDYFAGSYFPAVWFAPVTDETPVVDELKPGGQRRRRIVLPPTYTPQMKRPISDDEEALMCMGVI